MNIDRKKATKRRQGLTFHENQSILKSLGITEKSDREIEKSYETPPGSHVPWTLIGKKLRNAARASRSMKIDRFWKVLGSLKRVIERSKKATKRRQGLTFHEHWSEKSSETPPGPHVPWTLIGKRYETPPGPHVPWTLIEKKLRNAARASRSMNIDRKKATKRRQGLTFHEHWSKKATKRRQGLTFHENRSILKSLGIIEKSDRKQATPRRQGLTFHEHWSEKGTKRRQGLTFHEHWSEKSYETPPGPHVPWTLIGKKLRNAARASRSMNIDRKKLRNAARASRSMKIDRFWKVLGSLKRVIERSIMEFRQCVCFPSENAFENFDDNTDHPWQDAFSEGKQTHWWNSRQGLTFHKHWSKKKLRNAARASRSMNIDRKKLRNAARASRSMKIDRFWKVLGSLKRVIERSIMEFRQCVCFPSENAFENFDDNTDHPWQDAFSEGKQTHWWNSRQGLTFHEHWSKKKLRNAARASRSMNIDRKKLRNAARASRSMKIDRFWKVLGSLQKRVIERSIMEFRQCVCFHIPWKSIDFEKSWDHWKEW